MMISTSQPGLVCVGVVRCGQARTPSASAVSQGSPPILGRVLFRTHRGELAAAILEHSGIWHCPKLPVLDRVLNALFCPDPTGRGIGGSGDRELERVARWIKGNVDRPEKPI